MKKAISVLLACLLLLPTAFSVAFAAETQTQGEFTVFSYNVAGLPDIGFISGNEPVNVVSNQVSIGKFVSAQGYDIFATQEDFGYHDNLAGALTGYAYQTYHHGGVPYGDGTNVFTQAYPIYNEEHIPWDSLYGIADDGADEFSQKGVTYVCIQLTENVYVDFYDIHADAYGDEGSVAARRDNFRQLAELINSRTVDRPVIVTGDFNASLFNDNSLLKETLVDGCGLKDAWTEVKNGGNYTDCSYFSETYGDHWTAKWGVWDSVERYMYKDGGGITLTCTEFEYVDVLNNKGLSCSDHLAVYARFAYNASAASGDIGSNTQVKENNGFAELLRRFVTFIKALFLGITNFDKVREYLGF